MYTKVVPPIFLSNCASFWNVFWKAWEIRKLRKIALFSPHSIIVCSIFRKYASSIIDNGDSYLGLPSPASKQLINFQSQVWERIQLSIHVWIFAPIAKKLSFRSISISCHSQENAWREWREKNMCEFVNFRRPSFLKDIFLKSKMSEEEIGKCLF